MRMRWDAGKYSTAGDKRGGATGVQVKCRGSPGALKRKFRVYSCMTGDKNSPDGGISGLLRHRRVRVGCGEGGCDQK